MRDGRVERRGTNRVLRIMVRNWALGIGTGFLCAGLVLALDVAHLRTLLVRSDSAWIGLALLFGGFGATFGGLVAGTAIMFLREERESGGAGKPLQLIPAAVPATVDKPARRPY